MHLHYALLFELVHLAGRSFHLERHGSVDLHLVVS